MNRIFIFFLIIFFLPFVFARTDCSTYISCDACASISECGWCQSDGTCKTTGNDCESPLAKSCPPFFSLSLILTSIACFIGGALASGGGVGGGPIYIPAFILILGVSPHEAIPLSKVTIFGVAIGGFIILARKKHPKVDRPLIDFSIALLMEPITLWGTIVGVYMNITFPTFLLVAFLVLILGFNSYRTYKKGFTLLKQERAAEKQESSGNIQETYPLLKQEEVSSIIDKEKKFPFIKFFTLVGLEIGLVILLLLKGGHGASIIGVTCGTWQYWLILAVTFPYIFVSTAIIARILNREYIRKQELGYVYQKEDPTWTLKNITLYSIFSLIAGVAAGFLGIGAGVVIGPLLLEMGILPQVATATSSYMILFTSSATTAQFFIFGRLVWQYALWFWTIGLFAAMIGQYVVVKIIQKYKKQAFVNFLLATIILLSIILVVIVDGLNLSDQIKQHAPIWKFNPICGSD